MQASILAQVACFSRAWNLRKPSKQTSQDFLQLQLSYTRDRSMWLKPTDRDCHRLIADRPRNISSIYRCRQPVRPRIVRLYDSCRWDDRRMPVQQISIRDHNDRPDLPKLRQLSIRRKPTPIELSNPRCRYYARTNTRWRLQFIVFGGHNYRARILPFFTTLAHLAISLSMYLVNSSVLIVTAAAPSRAKAAVSSGDTSAAWMSR